MTASYEVEYLVAPSTIHVTIHPSYQVSPHQRELTDQILRWLDHAEGSTYLVLDMTDLKIDWTSLVMGLGDMRWKDLRRANFRALVVVTSSDMVAQGMKAFSRLQYGGFQVAVFPTVEEAMGYVGDTYYAD